MRFSESIKYHLGPKQAKLSLRLYQGLEKARGKRLIGPCTQVCLWLGVWVGVSMLDYWQCWTAGSYNAYVSVFV